MLGSIRNVKYQLVVRRECLCSGLCLPVGADLAGECRKPLKKNRLHKWKNKTAPVHSANVHLLCVPGTVLGAWGEGHQ